VYDKDKVLVEYRDKDRRMAPFVALRKGDIPTSRIGYEAFELEAPYIAPSRILTLDDLNRRGFGEALLTGLTPEERAIAMISRDLEELDKRITRREEWIAVQTLLNNGFAATAYIDEVNESARGEDFDVYYSDPNGNNPALFTIADQWDTLPKAFWGDVEAMCKNLAARGLPAADLIIGSDVATFITNDDSIYKLLFNNWTMNNGALNQEVLKPGVSKLGELNFGGFKLNVFSVWETYVDDAGVTQPLFPTDGALVTAPGCGHMLYGRVDQMEIDHQFHSRTGTRIPKHYSDIGSDLRKQILKARPLAAPHNRAPWLFAAHVVSDN
jgi:hypothetical protein